MAEHALRENHVVISSSTSLDHFCTPSTEQCDPNALFARLLLLRGNVHF